MARHSPLLRLLLGLTLVLQTLVGPATPISAQTGPTVTFTPGTVPPGGTIFVSGGSWPTCEVNANFDLIASTTGAASALQPASVMICEGFSSLAFTVPTSVAPGSYRVRVTAHDPHGNIVALSNALLTVSGPAGGGLSGTAACNIPPLTVLPNAFVTVMSGTVVVATTRADGAGAWSVPGPAPTSTYVVHYQAFEGQTTCDVPVTTNSDGNGTASTSIAPRRPSATTTPGSAPSNCQSRPPAP